MKNIDIVKLMSCGVAEITSHCLTAPDAYKVYRFRRSLKKASEAIISSEREMLADAGIMDVAKFDARLRELRASGDQPDELTVMEAKLDKYNSMRSSMLEDESAELYAPELDYEHWKALQDENHNDQRDPLVGVVEEILEGIMWTAPEGN